MSEEYNPQANVIESIERLEVELKELIRKRNHATNAAEKDLLTGEVAEMEADLKRLQHRLPVA